MGNAINEKAINTHKREYLTLIILRRINSTTKIRKKIPNPLIKQI
jgi:hypothetical protein